MGLGAFRVLRGRIALTCGWRAAQGAFAGRWGGAGGAVRVPSLRGPPAAAAGAASPLPPPSTAPALAADALAAALRAGGSSMGSSVHTLSMLPRACIFLNRIKLIRTAGAFATQYWFYEQIAALGRTGRTRVGIGVMAATRAQTKAANTWLAERKAALATIDGVSE